MKMIVGTYGNPDIQYIDGKLQGSIKLDIKHVGKSKYYLIPEDLEESIKKTWIKENPELDNPDIFTCFMGDCERTYYESIRLPYFEIYIDGIIQTVVTVRFKDVFAFNNIAKNTKDLFYLDNDQIVKG